MADTAIGRLIVDLRANFANFSDDFEKAGKIFERSAKKMEAVGKRMSIAITAPLAAIGTAALYAGQQIDDAMDTIRIRTGKTGDALGQLQNDFKKLASSVPSSFQDTSNAIALLNSRLGLTGAPLQELSRQFLDLFLLVGSAEVELADISARIDLLPAELNEFVTSGDCLPDCILWFEVVVPLIHVGNAYGFADFKTASQRLFLAGNHLEKRGLTCAVRADDAHDTGRWQGERQVFIQ